MKTVWIETVNGSRGLGIMHSASSRYTYLLFGSYDVNLRAEEVRTVRRVLEEAERELISAGYLDNEPGGSDA